ncbi:hypothetical protein UH38_00185 [Aliterella atlantica CENA595]|uniref:PEP-CTERM sorting domain-containing protein n=2 Tax=Aliterella TaxID=1827277 RepID=A0A0D8ZY14_9CYAN|nr:hypothetical protein UH38_00185 [Aliterella atlantica CENA595]
MDTIFTNKSARKLLPIAASFAAVYGVSTPANAFTIGSLNPDSAPGIHANKAPYTVGITSADVGKTFSTYWILKGATTQPLKAKAYFKVTELTSSNLSLDTVLFNRTDDSFRAALTNLGLGVSPNANKVSFKSKGDVFKYAYVETGKQYFPGGYQDIDVCINTVKTGSKSNCAGGAVKDGLQAGDKDIFGLDIAGKYGNNPTVTLQTFPVKFHTSEGIYELSASKPREVPTPAATLGIIAFGAISAVSTLKRKSKSITE